MEKPNWLWAYGYCNRYFWLYISNLPLTIVKPGSQTRKFTHIDDTIKACIYAWKQNKCKHYSISAKRIFNNQSS